MTDGVAFKTRARTIDHLGRGQIADSPTAVSELWKNAYDAYAANVELHIFDGEPEVAAIFDDGAGMNRDDFLNRWLVIGTESKLDGGEAELAPRETFGLPPRERQGEKGIGRLSAAFLAPATVVIGKRRDSRFAAVMVDWRFFENPFISLDDIRLPVEEFEHPDQAVQVLRSMVDVLRSNLGNGVDERARRLREAWNQYSSYQRKQSTTATTHDAIREFWSKLPLTSRHLDEWSVSAGLVDHGTALFLLGIHHELAVWVRPTSQDDEAEEVKERLRDTLSGFTDPYTEKEIPFNYAVLLNRGGKISPAISMDDVFGYDDLRGLEHYLDGAIDEHGVFRGRVVAFGEDLGIREIIPSHSPPTGGNNRLGSFAFCIGTFEQNLSLSTLSDQQHTLLLQQKDLYGGIKVYRDDLRVMPYGRPDADFLGIEERRSKHAGRYFWSHRRSFGRIAFTHQENPNLKDKAGREGLVENQAKRVLRRLVINVLLESAYRFFGTDASVRQDLLPEIVARNEAAKKAADKARKRRRRSIRQFLKEQRESIEKVIADLQTVISEAERVREMEEVDRVPLIAARYQELASDKDELRPPPVPTKLGDLEDQYREYRDNYREYLAGLDRLASLTTTIEAELGSASPTETAESAFHSHQSTLSARVDSYLKGIDARLEDLRRVWRAQGEDDRGIYYKTCRPLLDDQVTSAGLIPLLNLLDVRRREMEENFSIRYEPFINALEQLAEGIDLDSALTVVEDQNINLEDRIRDLNAVAQVGITVEIIGHEFETLDAEIRRNLMRLPADVRKSSAFKSAYEAQSALTERLRFLSPLKVAGYRSREAITGDEIADYVKEFFERTFRDNRIDFRATDAFRSMRIVDLRSRILPAFVNLVNNAVYWVSQVVDRRITLHLVGGLVIVADSGPGVDPDDVPRLFEMFFTRRRGGRGVGLYLTQANLAVAHHRIRYASEDDPKVLPGANFVIDFRGLTADD